MDVQTEQSNRRLDHLEARLSELGVTRRHTYSQILRSSVLIGASSVMTIVIGIVRTKVFALLLGPAGIGLLGLYSSIADVARSVAGMGLNSSGVRQIAEAVGTADTPRIARTVITLRRLSVLLGAVGALLVVALSQPISRFSFGDAQHMEAVALLALAVFFGVVSSGQIALVQGMRRIGDLARANVFGALYGTLFGILIVWFMGEAGVVPSLVCVAVMGLIISWWYSRKIHVEQVIVRWTDFFAEVSPLLKLGLVFMTSAFMMMGAGYLVRIIVLRQSGEAAAGFYQSAWTLGGLYVGFILQAMGADFFPRLTAAAEHPAECNRLVNEQAEVSLLLAGPGIVGTLTFAPLIIVLFYSSEFGPAVEILRWICVGMLLRVASWPLGFVLVAKGERGLYFWTELASNVLYIGLVWLGVKLFGLRGTGIAFFVLYVFYWLVIYLVVRRLTGFQWSAANRQVGLVYAPLVAVVFGVWYLLPDSTNTPLSLGLPNVLFLGLGCFITVLSGFYSVRRICSLMVLERLPRSMQRLLMFLRLVPVSSQHK